MDIRSQSRSRAGSFLVALSIAVMAVAAGIAGPANGASIVKGHILVQPRAGLEPGEFEGVLAPHGGKVLGRLGDLDVYVVQLPANASETAVAALLGHNPHIKFAEPDELFVPDVLPNDTYYGSEWHLQMVQAPAAWDFSLGANVTVAILDTGVNSTHPDLQGKLVPGWNFYDNNSNTADVYGHGTLVAGVVAALSSNAIGVTSIAWNAKLMPIRISAPDGMASSSTIASGLNWAANNGARVANISYAVHGSSTVQSAAQYMKNKGGLVVNSAGNSGTLDSTPASDTMISVSATGSSDTRASWSTWGPYVDVAAPGVGIWSTNNGGGYSSVSGTSFSSPLTAGVIALMISANPSLAPSQVERFLKSTAADLGTAGYDQYYGYGRVNAASAVQAAAQAQVSDTQPPTVAIASPTGGTVSAIVPVNVAASDNIGVTRVDLLVNGAPLATDTTSPYGFSWDSTKVADGSATLVARAYDAAGNSRNSTAVSVTVANTVIATVADTTLPTVTISNPANGSKVAGVTTITASSTDNVGVRSLSLSVDGVVVASGNVSSTSYKWNTRKASSGTHTIGATATDLAGNKATKTIQVTK